MGQHDSLDKMAATFVNTYRSLMSQSSNESLPLSSASGGSTNSGMSQTSDTAPLVVGSSGCHGNPGACPMKGRQPCRECSEWARLDEREQFSQLIGTALDNPDAIVWKTPPQSVKLYRGDKGLGFKYKDIKGKLSEKTHTIVVSVATNGPASGKLHKGDCILSANKQPMGTEQGITLKTVASAKTKLLSLVIQSPGGINSHPSGSSKKHRRYRSVSQERIHPENSMSSLEESEDENVNVKRNVKRLHTLGHRGDPIMPRVPCLRVLISGCESDSVALSLLGDGHQVKKSITDVGNTYRTYANQSTTGFTLGNGSPYKDTTARRLTRLLQADSSEVPVIDRVDLEVVALRSDPHSAYCQHILATAHSVYIIQFRYRDFLQDDGNCVLLSVQRQLDKIRTYASSSVPVYIVVTHDGGISSQQAETLSQRLTLQFNRAFGNQLQYNSATDQPCFIISRGSRDVQCHGTKYRDVPGLNNLGQLGDSLRQSLECNVHQEECCRILSPPNHNSWEVYYYQANPHSPVLTRTNDELGVLRSHLARVAYKQTFIHENYPFRFLIYQEQVRRLRSEGISYAFKKTIYNACDGLPLEDEGHLLRYLHDSGDVICADFLAVPPASSTTLASRVASDNVLLHRQHLITTARRLTTVPDHRSSQQDPRLHNSVQHWQDLIGSATASEVFTDYLLGNENHHKANDLTMLALMNVIHCMEPDASMFIPFFRHQENPRLLREAIPDLETDPDPAPDSHPSPDLTPDLTPDPDLYNLCLDCKGSIPDGLFLSVTMCLVKKAQETHGTWSIDSLTSAHLSLANDCGLELRCDELRGVIDISARCNLSYNHQDVLTLLSNIVDNQTTGRDDLSVTFGPPCPLPPYQCSVREGLPGRVHVIDVARGTAPRPMWCGDVQIDVMTDVERWLHSTVNLFQSSPLPGIQPVRVSLRAHIKKLPPSLFNWLCDQLNFQPVGHDWQALAGILGYNIGDVRVFANQQQHPHNPCSSLLLNWASLASATLGNLVQILLEKLHREDIVLDMQERWRIVP